MIIAAWIGPVALWRKRDGLTLLVALLGDPEDLFDRRNPFQNLPDTVVVKRCHTAFYGRFSDVLGRGALESQLADFGAHGHQLKNAQSAPVAAVATVVAALALH